jgi:hypothetical protein
MFPEKGYLGKDFGFFIDSVFKNLYFSAVLTQAKSGNNSVVECNLAKVEVASSNLVSRSKIDAKRFDTDRAFFY